MKPVPWKDYKAIADDFDASIAFQVAMELVFGGRKAANGYTEVILHARRKQVKALRGSH